MADTGGSGTNSPSKMIVPAAAAAAAGPSGRDQSTPQGPYQSRTPSTMLPRSDQQGGSPLAQPAHMPAHRPADQPSPRMAVTHMRRTRSDHVMSSRSRESSNSRSDSPRRPGDEVLELFHNVRKKITDNLFAFPSPFGRRRERRTSSRSSDKDAGAGQSGACPNGCDAEDTNGDLLDLEDFEFVENIELNHMDGFVVGGKRDVWRGHCFEVVQLHNPRWCDHCGDFIWGLDKWCIKCKNCELTCHHKCRQLLTVECNSASKDGKPTSRSETSLVERGAKAKIYSRDTVVYAKRPSLCDDEEDRAGREDEKDLFEEDLPGGVQRPPLRPKEAWRTLKKLDGAHVETSFNDQLSPSTATVCLDTVSKFEPEDDADSGYHTGESTLRGVGGAAPQPAPPPPGERTLTREDLKRRIDAFNDNQHGLVMKIREGGDTFQGFIRVYMNLMRPISMSLTARPPSIYDVLTPDADSDSDSDTQTTSFYLPKDTTKVIHITSDTTAQEVIRALLQKFRITDNPRKFALYEKIEELEQKSSMRRLGDDECPLALCLSWTSEGLNHHRFILQENDTGEIMWEAFSIPELDNFLRILDREEDEYVEQLKAKFHLLRIQITQHMKPLEPKQKQYKNDHRRPVFV